MLLALQGFGHKPNYCTSENVQLMMVQEEKLWCQQNSKNSIFFFLFLILSSSPHLTFPLCLFSLSIHCVICISAPIRHPSPSLLFEKMKLNFFSSPASFHHLAPCLAPVSVDSLPLANSFSILFRLCQESEPAEQLTRVVAARPCPKRDALLGVT